MINIIHKWVRGQQVSEQLWGSYDKSTCAHCLHLFFLPAVLPAFPRCQHSWTVSSAHLQLRSSHNEAEEYEQILSNVTQILWECHYFSVELRILCRVVERLFSCTHECQLWLTEGMAVRMLTVWVSRLSNYLCLQMCLSRCVRLPALTCE